jgi:riboflavin biosynthesis pyrimidine reductase
MLGRDGRPALDLAGPARIADAPRWRLVDVARVGTDVRLDYEPPVATDPAEPPPWPNGKAGTA